MMRAKLILIVVSIIFISCDKNNTEPIILTDGTYVGSFSRSSPTAKYQASEVTIVLEGNTFDGESSIMKYPAICKGTFRERGQKVEFINECIWTAEFDWTFILDGEYDISKDGEKIIISKSYGGGTYDTYSLSKE